MNDAFKQPMKYIIIGCGGLFVLALLLTPAYNSYKTEHTITTTICSKESVNIDNGHEYRVYTVDGTFAVKDHVVNGLRTRSADTYGRLQSNTTYEITYYGWRNGVFSLFPNILEATKVPEEEQQPNAC